MKQINNKIAIALTLAFALIGLGACGNEATPDGETPTVSDEEGMVTLYAQIGTQWGGTTNTRSEAPASLTQDLGNGYVLESTLTTAPATRGTTSFGTGTIFMVAFNQNETDKSKRVVGYEVIQVTNGTAKVQLKQATYAYKLVFYSEHLNNTQWNPHQYVVGAPDAIVTESQYNKFMSVDPTQTTSTDNTWVKDIPLKSSVAEESSIKELVDVMYTSIANVSTTAGSSLGTIAFNHILSQITWTLQVNGGAGETIGKVDAQFYPRFEGGITIFDKVCDPDGLKEESMIYPKNAATFMSEDEKRERFFYYNGTSGQSSVTFPARRFLPNTSAPTNRIGFHTLGIVKDGIATEIKGQYITLPMLTNEYNTHYILTSKVTKKPGTDTGDDVVIDDYEDVDESDNDFQPIK
ncbi:MAG: hypothetical protein LBN24_00885 [Mediterranea sp.]|jgi:hypothetical protein|nr:hypothetical protein [Mediterranea sp.]